MAIRLEDDRENQTDRNGSNRKVYCSLFLLWPVALKTRASAAINDVSSDIDDAAVSPKNMLSFPVRQAVVALARPVSYFPDSVTLLAEQSNTYTVDTTRTCRALIISPTKCVGVNAPSPTTPNGYLCMSIYKAASAYLQTEHPMNRLR